MRASRPGPDWSAMGKTNGPLFFSSKQRRRLNAQGILRQGLMFGRLPVQFARKGRSPARYAFAVKPKQEAELFKAALRAGIRYAESRGAVEFEPTDSASDKALYVYRLLVHDKIITPMPEDQVGEKTVRHRLASWYAHLPRGHPLLS